MLPIKTTCPYCGVGCGVTATPEGGRDLRIEGDVSHPANGGRLCSKGTHLGETVGLEGRLLHPMIGNRRASWDTALATMAERLRETIAEHGPDSVAFYVSGQLLTEDYYVANKLMKGFIGSGNIDTNSRLCMASAVAAHDRAFGEDIVPCSYSDLDEAELILLVGSNTAWCHPVVWQRIEKAREERGTKLVVIDPRRTETAAMADLHVPVAPDGDVPLFTALLAAMAERDLLDREFITAHCDVPDGYLATLSSKRHGIDPQLFAELATLVAAHPRMVTLFSQGVNQSVCGTDKGNAIINLHLATGRINRAGAGPFSITGQPNAMGGREVGGLANMLACHLKFSEGERDAVRTFWKAPRLCHGPGLKAVEMFRAISEGRIRFVWIMATNPAVSMPDAGFVRQALANCPTVVVSDVIADTDTGRLAHIRLPALAWGEKDGTVTNSDRTISRQRAVFAPPGETRADWRIVCDLAAQLGHRADFAYENPAAVFREYAAMTRLAAQRGKRLDLTDWEGCSDTQYDRMLPFQWAGRHPCEERFPTASGKAAIVPVAAAMPDRKKSLSLNTGRYRDQWHTMTRTGLSARLASHRREPVLEISPVDARARGLADGEIAGVATGMGEALYRVAVTDRMAPGQIFVPIHWTDANSGNGRTGRLVHSATDPVSGQPGFKNVEAECFAVHTDWRAFLLTRDVVTPVARYWVRSRIPGGWITELAGDGAIELDHLLPDGARSEVCDRVRGMQRIAVTDGDGNPQALLYITRTGELPARDWLIRQFSEFDAEPAELLAGRPGTPQPDAGPLVCVCHDVGETIIREAIAAGSGSVAEIGEATCAGTNCGSCRPLIADLLEHAQHNLEETAQ